MVNARPEIKHTHTHTHIHVKVENPTVWGKSGLVHGEKLALLADSCLFMLVV